ncbi:MAG TPA: ABC transporter permease, partial [Verrucomicrobiae bacterium]|nr:ABC transporter permease [Verrucomicrobiae bacterium]
SVVLGILVSARANDPRTAQQIGAVIVVPLVAVVIAQAAGRFLVDATGYGLAAVAVLLLALAGLRAGTWLFAREAILTRWR